jgi:hypothetical protein
MDSISGVGTSTNFAAPLGSAQTNASSASDSSSVGPAATLELKTLQLQSSMVSTLFGGLTEAAAPSPLFAGSSMMSLLNAQGSAALAYVAPSAPSTGQSINALA